MWPFDLLFPRKKKLPSERIAPKIIDASRTNPNLQVRKLPPKPISSLETDYAAEQERKRRREDSSPDLTLPIVAAVMWPSVTDTAPSSEPVSTYSSDSGTSSSSDSSGE